MIGGEGARVVAPERRTHQGWCCAGDHGDVVGAPGERLFEYLRIKRAMIAVPRRGGVEAQDVASRVFTQHGFAPPFTAAGPWRASLDKKHRLDAWLNRVVGQHLKYRPARIGPAGGAGAIVESEQEADRRGCLQALLGLRRQGDRWTDATTETERKGEHRDKGEDQFHSVEVTATNQQRCNLLACSHSPHAKAVAPGEVSMGTSRH